MCSIDGDRPDVYRSTFYRARKHHKCEECGRQIAPGEEYERAAMMYDREWSQFTTCSHCKVGHQWLLDNCNGFMHAGLIEEMEEHATEYPEIKIGFLRIKVGMRRKWRRSDGTGLMDLPRMPQEISV